jgi:hypothetical protein
VSRSLDAEILALLSLTHERCGRTKRAQGVLGMARRSRGEEFEAQVQDALRRLNTELDPSPAVSSTTREKLRAALMPKFAEYLGPSTARLAAA